MSVMENTLSIQDTYPEDASHCYGCGRLNEEGFQIKTRLDRGYYSHHLRAMAAAHSLRGNGVWRPDRLGDRLPLGRVSSDLHDG